MAKSIARFDRRQFISGCLATAAAGRLAAAAETPASLDPNLVVVISDIHAARPWSEQKYRTGREYPHVCGKISQFVNEILAMRPLPANVVGLGDLSLAFAEEGDYALCRRLLKPLEDAGITVTHALGNHDRVAEFLTAYPEYSGRVMFGDKVVSEVSTPHADFILIDTHVECAPEERGKYETCRGFGCGKEQKDWLTSRLLTSKKPTFVCSHHQAVDVGLKNLVSRLPTVFGYLHGHHHHWMTNYVHDGYGKNAKIILQVGFPSFGIDNDVGYGVMRIGEDHAELSCVVRDYYFPVPADVREKEGASGRRPAAWDAFRKNWEGRSLTFAFDK